MSRTDPCTPGMRKLIVLGSTGSIGLNTLHVVDHLNRAAAASIEVVGLAAGRSAKSLIEQARRFSVRHVAIAEPSLQDKIKAALPDAAVFAGPQAACKLVEEVEATDLAAAMVGSAGLEATLAGIRRGLTIALSNKETLVAAGELVTQLVRKHNATLLPVDSEHSAIFQCLAQQQQQQQRPGAGAGAGCRVKRIVLTASGGPFRTADKKTIENATVEQALNHPTWNMGPKITIDSASMMNKALEIIEANWLFDLPEPKSSRIEVIIHPQSVVHSFVEFTDNSILAQLGPPDMRTPIQYALTYPDRVTGCSEQMDWSKLSKLTFEPPDFERFGALKLAYAAIETGGTAGAVLNGANEAAVAAFLGRKVRFGAIVDLVGQAMKAIDPQPLDCVATVLDADRRAREFVNKQIDAQLVE